MQPPSPRFLDREHPDASWAGFVSGAHRRSMGDDENHRKFQGESPRPVPIVLEASTWLCKLDSTGGVRGGSSWSGLAEPASALHRIVRRAACTS